MVGQAEGGELVVAAKVLRDAGGDAGQACFLQGVPSAMRMNASIAPAMPSASTTRPVPARLPKRATGVVGGAQSVGLIERGVKVGVVAWRQGAGDDLVAVVDDRLVVHVEHRSGGVEQGEGVAKDAMLELGVAGPPEGAPERKIAPQARGGAVRSIWLRCEPRAMVANPSASKT